MSLTIQDRSTKETLAYELIEKIIVQKLQAVVDNSHPCYRITADILLDRVLPTDGRMKTQFEMKTSGRCNENKIRARAEKLRFGYPLNLPAHERPVYGYLCDDPAHDWQEALLKRFNMDQYGDVVCLFNRKILKRSTVTFGDSFGTLAVPAPAEQINIISAASYHVDRIMELTDLSVKGLLDSGVIASYVEIQVHGGVSLDDVEKVFIYKYGLRKWELRNELHRVGIPAIIVE